MKRIALSLTALALASTGATPALAAPVASASEAAKERTVVLKLSLVQGGLVAAGRVGADYGRGPIVIQSARCNAKGKACGPYRKLRAAKTSADGRYRIAGMPLPWCRDAKILVRAAVPAKDGLPRTLSSEHSVCKYVR